MKQSYEDNRGPFESQPPRGFSYTFGLHAYAFMHYQADTIFVTIRGTDFDSVGVFNDLQQDYKLYGVLPAVLAASCAALRAAPVAA